MALAEVGGTKTNRNGIGPRNMTRLPRIRAAVAAAVALAAWTFGAGAGHAASRDEQAHACRGDALHLCAADVPNKAKITACMKQHYDQLSPGCKAMFDQPASDSRPNV